MPCYLFIAYRRLLPGGKEREEEGEGEEEKTRIGHTRDADKKMKIK